MSKPTPKTIQLYDMCSIGLHLQAEKICSLDQFVELVQKSNYYPSRYKIVEINKDQASGHYDLGQENEELIKRILEEFEVDEIKMEWDW